MAGEIAQPTGREIINDHNVVVPLAQQIKKVGADEPRAACHQQATAIASLFMSLARRVGIHAFDRSLFSRRPRNCTSDQARSSSPRFGMPFVEASTSSRFGSSDAARLQSAIWP